MAEAKKQSITDLFQSQATAPRDASQHFRHFPGGLFQS
jgi:hypothetical protein